MFMMNMIRPLLLDDDCYSTTTTKEEDVDRSRKGTKDTKKCTLSILTEALNLSTATLDFNGDVGDDEGLAFNTLESFA